MGFFGGNVGFYGDGTGGGFGGGGAAEPLATFRFETVGTDDLVYLNGFDKVGVEVDWGDGNTESIADGTSGFSHTYAVEGTYDFKITAGTMSRLGFYDSTAYDVFTGIITPISADLGLTSGASMFYRCKFTTMVDAAFDAMSPGLTGSCYRMFGASNTTYATEAGVWCEFTGCDFSNVTNAEEMFYYQDHFNKQLPSDWSSATTMESFLQDCREWNNGGQAVSFDISSATDIESMFERCGDLAQNITLTLRTAGGVDGDRLFSACSSLNHTISMDGSKFLSVPRMFVSCASFNHSSIGSLSFPNATDFTAMMSGMTAFNQNIGSWDVSSGQIFNQMFQSSTSFNNGGSNTINNWDMSSATSLNSMFYGCTAFNQPVGGWTVTSVTDLRTMFYNCDAFNQNLAGWTLSGSFGGTNMYRFLFGCHAFNGTMFSLPTTATSLQQTFFECHAFNQDITGWNTANVTNMDQTFYACRAFNQNISTWNVTKVTTFNYCFYDNEAFNQPIGAWTLNTTGTVTMTAMFSNCTVFNQDLSGWDTSKVTTMQYMFNGPCAFNQDITGWDLSSCTNLSYMFQQNTAFNNGGSSMSGLDVAAANTFRSMFFGATSFNQPVAWGFAATTGVSNFRDMFHDATSFDQDISSWNFEGGTSFVDMLDNATAFSQENMDKLLMAWQTQTLNNYQNIDLGGAKHSPGAPAEAYANLIATVPTGPQWTVSNNGGLGYFCDTHSPDICYSTIKLRSAQTNCIRIREDGGDTETDIGFDSNGILDAAAIATHCGANNGFVTKWYDQSGGSDDAVEATNANQPKIYDGSAVIELGGLPAIDFDGAAYELRATSLGTLTQPSSYMVIASHDVTGNGESLVGTGTTASDETYPVLTSSGNFQTYAGTFLSYGYADNLAQNLFVSLHNGASSDARYNTDETAGAANTRSVVTNLDVGHARSSGYWDGKIQTVIFFNSDQSANYDAIEENLRASFDNIYSADANTDLWLPMNYDFVDKSQNQFAITANGGATIDTSTVKYGDGSGSFGASTDSVSVADNAAWTPAAGWTCEFWFKTSTATCYLAGQADSSNTNTSTSFHFVLESGVMNFRVGVGSDLVSQEVDGGSSLNDDSWHHCAGVIDNDGVMNLYIDGTSVGTPNDISAKTPNNSTNDLSFGRVGEYTSTGMVGNMDDIRMSSVTRYSANFTPRRHIG